MTTPILWIIIPCYNEQEVLPLTAPVFLDKLTELIQAEKISPDSKILFVNDGSKDSTWEIINKLSLEDSHFIGISQSRNYGHQSALLAGLMEAKDKCDITISIDCDGQDDIHAMNKMVDEYLNGCEIVYGVRSDRTKDTWFKRYSAETYYRVLNMMGSNVVFNHADYRLASSKVLQAFSDFKEVNLFLRGMFPLVGFKSTSVYYERHERIAGTTHYTLGKMFALAFEGITSFSIKPLRMIIFLGILVACLSFIGVFWSILMYFLGRTVSGWASMTSLICFLGGVQLVCLGVLGEYIGKMYLETKGRPRYIISEKTWDLAEEDRNIVD